jgi:hypothetical protein
MPSLPAVARVFPSGEKTTALVPKACPSSSLKDPPEPKCNTRTLRSQDEAAASRLPSGETATDVMRPAIRRSRNRCSPLSRSHTTTDCSPFSPVTSQRPSGVNVAHKAENRPCNRRRTRPNAMSQTMISPVRSVVTARLWLLAENAIAMTRWIGMARTCAVRSCWRSQIMTPGSIPAAARKRSSGENATLRAVPGNSRACADFHPFHPSRSQTRPVASAVAIMVPAGEIAIEVVNIPSEPLRSVNRASAPGVCVPTSQARPRNATPIMPSCSRVNHRTITRLARVRFGPMSLASSADSEVSQYRCIGRFLGPWALPRTVDSPAPSTPEAVDLLLIKPVSDRAASITGGLLPLPRPR